MYDYLQQWPKLYNAKVLKEYFKIVNEILDLVTVECPKNKGCQKEMTNLKYWCWGEEGCQEEWISISLHSAMLR